MWYLQFHLVWARLSLSMIDLLSSVQLPHYTSIVGQFFFLCKAKALWNSRHIREFSIHKNNASTELALIDVLQESVFLLEAACGRTCLCVGKAQKSSDDCRGDNIGCTGDKTLGEHLVRRLCVDEDVEYWSNHTPGNDVSNDLEDVELEINAMDNIFRCSTLTLFAAAGDGAE